MSDKTLEQVPPECGNFYQNGLAALEKGDAASAITSFIQALEIEPGFVTCREALRRAQRKAAENKPGFWKRFFRKGCFSTSLSEAEVLVHLQPLKTISLAEDILNKDPGNVTAHKLLAQAALAADLPRTAGLSLQALTDQQPYHRGLKLELAEALAESGDTSAATAIYGQLLKDNPQDGKVQHALQRISAQFIPEPAPQPGNGHVQAQAAAPALQPLRRQPAPVSSISTDDAIIRRFEPLLVHGPKNTKFLKTLAEAYARKLMFDKSLSYYQKALKIAGGKNAAIETSIEETTLKKLDWELSKLDPKTPEYAAQRERIQNQKLEYQWHAMAEAH